MLTNLLEQLQRVANLWFLAIAVLSYVPGISSAAPITNVLPLAFVVAVTALKQGAEDYRRHRDDMAMNDAMFPSYSLSAAIRSCPSTGT